MKSDLLADLRADVEAAAREEQAAIQAAKAAKAAEEARLAAEAEAARQAEVARRLEAEARRQALVDEARAALNAPAEPEPVAEPAPVAAPAAPTPPVDIAEIAPPAPRSMGPWLAMGGMLMVCITAVVVSLIWTSKPTPAPKLATPPPPVLQVVDSPEIPSEALVLPTAHVPDPAAAPATEAQPVKTTKRTGKRTVGRRGGRSGKGGKASKGGKAGKGGTGSGETPLDLGDFMKAE